MRFLVVYYSRTGNARFVAEKVASELGADTEEVIDSKNRRGWLGFIRAGYDATRGKETKIEKTQKSPQDYDLIVVGTPVWNSRLTPAIRTYLKENDLSQKKIALFSTNEGRGNERTLSMMKPLIPNGYIVSELGISKALENREETESKISAWCSKLKST
ncbi:MAG: flavodoxin domain-containing protein [Candidatus Bathyarchaeia archaeon]